MLNLPCTKWMSTLFCLSRDRRVAGIEAGDCPSPVSTMVKLGFFRDPVAARVIRSESSLRRVSDQWEIYPSVLALERSPKKNCATASGILLGASTEFGWIPADQHSPIKTASTELTNFSTKAPSALLDWLPIVEKLSSLSPKGLHTSGFSSSRSHEAA